MAVLVDVCFACDLHHATKLCTVRSRRLQCLPSPSLWSDDGVGSTCVPPCGCMRGSQQCVAEHAARRSQRQGPAALAFGVVYGHGLCRSLEGGPQAVRGDIFQKVDVRTPCPMCGTIGGAPRFQLEVPPASPSSFNSTTNCHKMVTGNTTLYTCDCTSVTAAQKLALKTSAPHTPSPVSFL
jgi:hypothetical protein